jgi:tRNA dimethylallyltransferase
MTRPHDGRCILIAGPTASGKSGLALSLAERLGGVVINADSMQVYRELRILTARPTPQEELRAPHALYGCVNGSEAYSAGRYAADAARAIADARAQGRVPVVAGGTGLYFKVLLEGLSPVPPIDPAVRTRWRAEAARRPTPELHAILAMRDPAMASRLMPTDPQRIVRALEVLDSTGRSLADWQAEQGTPVLREEQTVRLLVLPDRGTHAQAIEARFDAMLAAGALEEVRRLVSLELSQELPIMRALGVAPLAAHLSGRLSLEEAAAVAKAETRQYAKRQTTWLKRNMISWKPISTQYLQRLDRDDLLFSDF